MEALHNPIAIIKDVVHNNEKSNNRYGIIVDLKNEKGNYVLVSADVDKNIGSNNIINDIQSIHSRQSFVPMLEKAVEDNRLIKIKESKLKDLILGKQSDSFSESGQSSLINSIMQKNESINGGLFFDESYRQDDQKNFFRNDMTGKYEGNQYAIDAVYKGEYIAYKNIIRLNETGDASTIMHELAHWFLAKLEKYSKQYNNLEQENPRLYQEMQAIRKFLCCADSATASQFTPGLRDGGHFTVLSALNRNRRNSDTSCNID